MIGLTMILLIAAVGLTVLVAAALYRIVPNGEAHVVVTPYTTMICSSNVNVKERVSNWYFAVPSFIPLLGRQIQIIDLKTQEMTFDLVATEKNMARYMVKSSLKFRVVNPSIAAETWDSEEELNNQLLENVKAAVRVVTVKYDVNEARTLKSKLTKEVQEEIQDDLEKYGLELVTFALVDFNDTADSKIVSNISLKREKEIDANTRQENAEKEKTAKIKEAEANEAYRQREIKRDLAIEIEEQTKTQKIQEALKVVREKEYEVKKVEMVKEAENRKAAQEVIKLQQKLEGEGMQAKQEAEAIGKAAEAKQKGLAEAEIIKMKGLAEAEALTKKQAALKGFDEKTIAALVAEKSIEMQREVGIATAQALGEAEVRLLVGGSQEGFKMSQMIEAMKLGNEDLANAALTRLSAPMNLGLNLPERIEKPAKEQKNGKQ